MKIPKSELDKFYSDKEIKSFERKGEFESYFWSRTPVLPIESEGKIELKKWGNRDKKINLPKTGWAKKESIDEGKWGYLKPEFVKIPAEKGYERGVWFKVEKGGFQGVVVKKDKDERVYMVTKPANKDYLDLTKHDRQPVEI